MKIGYRRRLADFAGGLRLQREFAKHERQPREDLKLYQQRRLESSSVTRPRTRRSTGSVSPGLLMKALWSYRACRR